jgi:hypothetical protein
MKAKIYRFIFSILLVCFAAIGKAQTIDGKLYTPFNNYYQWIGGKFNSNLNIPKITATTGRDTGGIRYNLTDSSMYVWTGSQWRQVGGGATPTLQQVTTAGNSTTDSLNIKTPLNKLAVSITSVDFAGAENTSGRIRLRNTFDSSYLVLNELGFDKYFSATGLQKELRFQNIRNQYSQINIPDSSGTLTQRVTINGTTYNTATNGVVDLGNTDTATVVKAYVTNAEAVTITKGQVVYIFGASGDRASVKLAKNTSDTFSSKTLGIVRADIAAGQAGWITTQGQVSGINLGAYSPGDILWLDSVPGGFTKTKPQAPYHAVFVGVVERANAGNGLIYVKPQNGVELDELHDVRITSLANNEIIRYNSSLGYWENKSITTTLGYTPLNVTDTTAMLTPYLRSNVAAATYQLILDTVPLAVFGAGSGAAGDTLAFSTSAVYGSFYNAGNDTLIITQMRAGVLGTSPSITTEVYWNDSLNITAGATILVTGGTSVTGTIGATNVTSFTNNKIPPNVWVFVRTSAVATKPTYFTLTLLGYRKRQ